MRIDGWSIAAFGPLTQWDATSLARHNILVVLGPNESGKSALFEFFASALFGFTPARADRHPYEPWDGRYLEGRLDVVLRDGSQARLSPPAYLTSLKDRSPSTTTRKGWPTIRPRGLA